MAENGDKSVPKARLICSYRFGLALVGFMGFINLYALRVNMSVAMVCMVNHTSLATHSDATGNYTTALLPGNEANGNYSHVTSVEDTCEDRLGDGATLDGEYTWTKSTQGLILGAFFWGYMLTQIAGGVLAERYGGKRVLGWSMFVTTVATLLTPVGASVSPYLLVFLRVVKGLGEGVVFPSMHCLWSKWAPPLERSKLIGFTYAGAQIGNVITLPISGLLCENGFAGGWPSIFYVCGLFSLVWFVLWMVLVSDSPDEHRFISHREKNYILATIGASKKAKSTREIPWKAIFTSPPVWAIIVAHTFANWGTYTMLTNIPAYMKEVLKFNIKANGLLSAIPYVAFWAFINIGGNVADFLRAKGMRTVVVRKLSVCTGMILPGIFLIATGFIDCQSPYTAVILLTIGIGLSGFQYSGQMVNHVDIAPPFAGTLFGISNTCATLPGILAPYAVALLTPGRSQEEWQNVFYVAAAIYTIGAIFYVFAAGGEIQDWAKPYMYCDEESVSVCQSNSPGHEQKQLLGKSNEMKPFSEEPLKI